MKKIIFTDLDGTLLDHDSYSWSEAKNALNLAKQLKIPIIFSSSKTVPEIELIRDQLGIYYSFIAENGAVTMQESIWDNKRTPLETVLAKEPRVFLEDLKQLKTLAKNSVKYITEFSTQELAEFTGLSLEGAKLAQERKASMPFIWTGSKIEFTTFESHASNMSYQIVQGGRFYHLMPNATKGSGLEYITKQYEKFLETTRAETIALGDSANDLSMLEAANNAVVIKTASGHKIKPDNNRTCYTSAIGPAGWNEAILDFLKT